MTDDSIDLCGADVYIRMADCLFEGIGTARDLRGALCFYQTAERLFYDRLLSGDFMIQKQYQKCVDRQQGAKERLQQDIPNYAWAKQ